jgi:tetratricopeptide (TPR) repeat protein
MESVKDLKGLLLKYREEGEEKQVANLAYKLGDIYRERGKWEDALPLLEESLMLCRRHENPEGEAIVALSLAELHLEQADSHRAEMLARPALAFYQGNQDIKGQVKASLLLGDSYWARKDYEAAIPYYEEALETCKAHQDVMGSASLLDRLAKMHRLLSREEQALAYFQESLECWQELSIPDREAMTWTNMGDICKRRGDLSRAIRCHEQALSLYQHLKNPKAVEALEKELESLKRTPSSTP